MSPNLVLVVGNRWHLYKGGKREEVVEYDEDAQEYTSTHEIIENFRTGEYQIDPHIDLA